MCIRDSSQYDSVAELIRHAIDFGYVWAEQGQGEPRWLDKWLAVMELELSLIHISDPGGSDPDLPGQRYQ